MCAARKSRFHRRIAAVVIGLVLAAGCGDAGQTGPNPSNAASQSPADAARDGVVSQLAALPLSVRADIISSVTADEGVWAISRPTSTADPEEGCRLGDPTGKYPTEVICTTEYGELLLLDESQSRIVKAFPLPAVPPEELLLTDDALYCSRSGAAMLPDSMLCRVDRQTLEAVVRIFPTDLGSVVVQPCFYPLEGWVIAPSLVTMRDLTLTADGLFARADDRTWTRFDPVSLEATHSGLASTEAALADPDPTPTATEPPLAEPTTTPESTPTPPVEPVPTSTTPPTPRPTTPAPSVLAIGATGEKVRLLQQDLIDLGYWISGATGVYGTETFHAVTALQKVAGLERTGVADAATLAVIGAGTRPAAQSASGRTIEIDLAHQVLLIVQDGAVEKIFDTSTGRASLPTPPGHFTIYDEVDGWHDAGLGLVFRPKYFYEGLSIHAYPEVPPWPASHGCARVIEPAINWLWDHGNVPIGTPVWIH